MFRYNSDGYLRPYKAIETTIESFENEFVTNPRRKNLFDKYLKFNLGLAEIGIIPYTQWINGSYVSKIELPNDIDLVTFVNYQKVLKFESRLKHLSWELRKWLDTSYVAVYPEGHPLNNITVILQNDYHLLYGSTRQNRTTLRSRPKGYKYSTIFIDSF